MKNLTRFSLWTTIAAAVTSLVGTTLQNFRKSPPHVAAWLSQPVEEHLGNRTKHLVILHKTDKPIAADELGRFSFPTDWIGDRARLQSLHETNSVWIRLAPDEIHLFDGAQAGLNLPYESAK